MLQSSMPSGSSAFVPREKRTIPNGAILVHEEPGSTVAPQTWRSYRHTVIRRYSVWDESDLDRMASEIDEFAIKGYQHAVYATGAEYVIVEYVWQGVIPVLPEEQDENA